ncbi:Rieske (2Fe-2S) protein [Kineosporia babensis]|uniref:Rieske (2Fe-2S) protein n=1 Tax=Kineosporia babensis TaxID=499548 RepID=A0A9X1NHJ2_9ACTN|nr:Rieske (2Fe-2S) protein [Kineosporia babensis]MCD5314150.1 Rieske (2Fe-2S) protein [Kineosporia babensis]
MTATLRSTGEKQPAAEAASTGFSRRRAMTVCSLTLLGAAGLAACGGGSDDEASTGTGTSAPESSGSSGGSAGGQTIAAVSDIAEGEAAGFELDGDPIIVAMPAAEQPVAFSAVCPHQGATVQVQGDQLVCPLHNSIFEKDTGAFVSGPADGQGLTPVEVSVENGNIVTS